jgi:hypothetical protein
LSSIRRCIHRAHVACKHPLRCSRMLACVHCMACESFAQPQSGVSCVPPCFLQCVRVDSFRQRAPRCADSHAGQAPCTQEHICAAVSAPPAHPARAAAVPASMLRDGQADRGRARGASHRRRHMLQHVRCGTLSFALLRDFAAQMLPRCCSRCHYLCAHPACAHGARAEAPCGHGPIAHIVCLPTERTALVSRPGPLVNHKTDSCLRMSIQSAWRLTPGSIACGSTLRKALSSQLCMIAALNCADTDVAGAGAA